MRGVECTQKGKEKIYINREPRTDIERRINLFIVITFTIQTLHFVNRVTMLYMWMSMAIYIVYELYVIVEGSTKKKYIYILNIFILSY